MPARIDRALVDDLAHSFPTGPQWRAFNCSEVIRDNGPILSARWACLDGLHQQGGVYCFTLPANLFAAPKTIPLHAPHTHEQPISFEFTVKPWPGLDGWGVVYVGRTTDLKRRFKLHLSRGEPKDGGQVKFGMLNSKMFANDADEALRAMREKGRLIYTVLPGIEHCANRDLLEMSLCARLAPPFNIKSER